MQVSKIVLTTVFIMGGVFQLFAQNLISNGGFESGSTGWKLESQTGFTAEASYPTSGAPEGTAYASVHVSLVTVTDPQQDNWKVQFQLPQWQATKNGVYRLAFKARGTAKQLKVGINRGGSGAYVAGYDINLDTTWQTRTCMFVSDTSGMGNLRLNFYIGADTGVYEFDSVSLEKTGESVPTENLIANGGFELEGASWGMYIQRDAGADAAVTYPSTGAPEGNRYASVTVTTASDGSQVQLQTPLFTADSGAAYTLTFKAKGTSNIKVVSAGDQSVNYQTKETQYVELTEDWATYSLEFLSDVSGSGAFRLNFLLGSAGEYDFDSVYVSKAPPVAVQLTSGKISQTQSLTFRKAKGGLIITLPNNAAQGSYSLSIYSLSGRLLERRSGIRNGAEEVALPLKKVNGAVLIAYSDRSGSVFGRTSLLH